MPFFPPKPDERLRIIDLHLPHNHLVDPSYLEKVALRCYLTGAQIRNAALHATLLAIEENTSVDRSHLEEALRSEHRKAGGTFPLSDNLLENGNLDGGMEEFVNALRSQ